MKCAAIALVLALAGSLNLSGCASLSENQARAAGRHAAKGEEIFQRGRVAEAVAEWRLALKLDPSRQELAQKIHKAENPGTGSEAMALPEGDLGQRVNADYCQAERLYQASQLKEAELMYKQILVLDPQHVPAQEGLNRMAEERYQPDARRVFDRMTENLYQEGMKLYRKKEWDGAEIKFSEAAKLNSEQVQVKKYLEKTRRELAKLKDLAQAQILVAQARDAERAQEWVKAYQAWLEAQRMQPLPEGAADGAARTRREVDNIVSRILDQANRDLANGKTNAALASFEKVLAIFPENADALSGVKSVRAGLETQRKSQGTKAEAQKLYNRGVEAYHKGNLPAAISAWEAAAAADPQDAGIRGQLLRAKKELTESVEKKRRAAQVRYEDGLAAYQRGELDEALAAWTETLELDPEHPKARANIQRVEQETK
jgi:tetratricopeptide (TPR) repeat protein